MKIVLLTGEITDQNEFCSALKMVNNKIWLDHQIEAVIPLNLEIEIVLGAKFSDDILRNSIYLRKFNIVFDPNEEEVGPLSNLRAGLFASNRECIVFPINFACPSLKVWQNLIGKLYQDSSSKFDIVRPYCPVNGEMTPGFPVGITAGGRETILLNKEITNLQNDGLKEYRLPVLDKRIFDNVTVEGHKISNAI